MSYLLKIETGRENAMTKSQTRLRQLRERQSMERGRMAELAVAESLTAETRAELDSIEQCTPDLERQIRAATSAVETEESEQRAAAPGDLAVGEDGEDRERAELRGKVKFGEYVAAAIEQRSAAGAELELNASMGIAGNRFPLELLAPPPEHRPPQEQRAVTAMESAVVPRRWLDRLFSGAASQSLGITMESVPVGGASFPVTTAGASAAQRAKDEAAADTSWERYLMGNWRD